MLLSEAYTKAKSKQHFMTLLGNKGLQLYTHGKHIGIIGKRKYRLQTLGFSHERIAMLDLEKEQKQPQLNRLLQLKQKDKQQHKDLDLNQEL